MTYQKAIELRDAIRAANVKCSVGGGPGSTGRSFCVVVPMRNFTEKQFRSLASWEKFYAKVIEDRKAVIRFAEERGFIVSQPRSPIEAMIDKACGVED